MKSSMDQDQEPNEHIYRRNSQVALRVWIEQEGGERDGYQKGHDTRRHKGGSIVESSEYTVHVVGESSARHVLSLCRHIWSCLATTVER